MVLPDYESELYPIGPDKQDFDWWKAKLLSLPTDELEQQYKEYYELLVRIRSEEPARKRGRKSEYRSWISQTHELLNLLNDIDKELQSRL